jgi:hypothetical protein
MVEPRPPASFPASLVERRTRLADRLESRSTPTEAVLTLHEVLDELQTIDLNQRSTRERQSAERALRIVRACAGFLQAVRAEPHWSRPIDAPHRRSGRPWRLIGLVGIQAGLGIVLLMLVSGVLQRGATSGDGSLTIGFILVAALLVLQAVTGYQMLLRPRGTETAESDRPEIALRVDSDSVLSTLSQALVAVDQLEQAGNAETTSALDAPAGLRAYPEVLRAIQHVYAARLSDDPQRTHARAEGLRASLEPYGLDLLDEWTESEPPPHDLFVTQRSLDPSSRTYRVILPAILDAQGVILPGRIAAPTNRAGTGAASIGDPTERKDSPR